MTSRALFLIIAAIVAWVMAFNTGHPIAYSLAYLLSGILLLSYFWARSSIGGIHLRRFTHSRRSQVGQFAEEQFEVTNRSVWPKLWVEIEDFSPAVARRRQPCRQRSRAQTQLPLARAHPLYPARQYRLGPMTIQSGDPLGVFNVTQELPQTSYLVVYPLAVDLTSFEPSISDLAGGEARHRRTYQMTTNAAGVRDYYPGDSLNRIHWPTTARMRRLMTKELSWIPRRISGFTWT
ncbi:MAG: DUF58 domain-containing protein [Caldilineaceae bacterium]